MSISIRPPHYVPSLDGQTMKVCPLTPAAKTFLGRDLHEAQDCFASIVQEFEQNRSENIQSEALFRAQQKNIVTQGAQKTKEANASVSKQSKLLKVSEIRDNRANEREFERADDAWLLCNADTYKPLQAPLETLLAETVNEQQEEAFIAAPTHTELLLTLQNKEI